MRQVSTDLLIYPSRSIKRICADSRCNFLDEIIRFFPFLIHLYNADCRFIFVQVLINSERKTGSVWWKEGATLFPETFCRILFGLVCAPNHHHHHHHPPPPPPECPVVLFFSKPRILTVQRNQRDLPCSLI